MSGELNKVTGFDLISKQLNQKGVQEVKKDDVDSILVDLQADNKQVLSEDFESALSNFYNLSKDDSSLLETINAVNLLDGDDKNFTASDLKKEYVKQQEKTVNIGSQSVSEQTYADIKAQIENEIAQKKQELSDTKENRGWLTNAGNAIAGFFGGGDKKTESEIEKLEKAYAGLETNPAKMESVYKTVMGKKLDAQTIESIKEASEFVSSLSTEEQNSIADALSAQIDYLQESFDDTKNNNGWISGAWDGFKNWTGIGASSNKTQTQLDNAKELLSDLKNNPENLGKAYKTLTGNDLTSEEYVKLATGETSLIENSKTSESVSKYQEGQRMATDVIADVAAGVSSAVVVTVCSAAGICAAPFTAGASLGLVAAGVGIASGTGAAVKCALKASDCIGNDRTYSLSDFKYDAITGAVNGAMAPITQGAGSAAGTGVAKVLGKEALESTVKGTAKQTLKQGLIKTASKAAQFAVDGSMSGAADGAARAIGEGRYDDILSDSLKGGATGLIASVPIGFGFDFAGAVGSKISSKVANKAMKETTQEVAQEFVENIDNKLALEMSDSVSDSVAKEVKKEVASEIDEKAAQELSESAAKLNSVYQNNIGTVQSKYSNYFDDLDSVSSVSARAKGKDSILAKLESKFKKGAYATDAMSCAEKIGDGYGVRVQLKSLDNAQAQNIVNSALDGTNRTYDDFIQALKSGNSLPDEYLKAVDALKEAQTDEFVETFIGRINSGDIVLANDEFNNYGNEISSYFTNKQLKEIADAYKEKTGNQLTFVNKSQVQPLTADIPIASYDGSVTALTEEEIKKLTKNNSAAQLTEKQIDKAVKDSGYTSTQANIVSKSTNGSMLADTELQIRGTDVNKFADIEHIPYDIRQGKITLDNPKYSEVYASIKGMSDDSYKLYNEYLTDVYQHLRLKELGIDTPLPQLSQNLEYATQDVLKEKGLDNLVQAGAKLSPEALEKLTLEGLSSFSH